MITPKSFVDGAYLTASITTYYTAGTGVRAIIRNATFANNHTSGVYVYVYIVPSGGVSGYANAIALSHYVEAGETWRCYDMEDHILPVGATIQLRASQTEVVGVRISGYEVTG